MLLSFDNIQKSFTFALKEKDFALNLVIGGILYLITGCLQQVMKINKNILENKIIGILEINPSLIDFKYLLRATLSKNGRIFSIGLIILSIIFSPIYIHLIMY